MSEGGAGFGGEGGGGVSAGRHRLVWNHSGGD